MLPESSLESTVESSVDSSVESRHQRYWEEFYSTSADRVPSEPSEFARWVSQRERKPGPLIDVGTGTGRDALWFASQGFTVFGCDYSHAGVEYASAHARDLQLGTVFSQVDIYDVDQMSLFARRICEDAHPTVVYARFFVHALEDDGRRNLWTLSREVLARRAGRLYLEFRTKPTEHEFGEHYRHFVSRRTVEKELLAHGFDLDFSLEGRGLAVHKSEDPVVSRIVAQYAS